MIGRSHEDAIGFASLHRAHRGESDQRVEDPGQPSYR
jgi:hypothetical protein